jgi:hypothetical protein
MDSGNTRNEHAILAMGHCDAELEMPIGRLQFFWNLTVFTGYI